MSDRRSEGARGRGRGARRRAGWRLALGAVVAVAVFGAVPACHTYIEDECDRYWVFRVSVQGTLPADGAITIIDWETGFAATYPTDGPYCTPQAPPYCCGAAQAHLHTCQWGSEPGDGSLLLRGTGIEPLRVDVDWQGDDCDLSMTTVAVTYVDAGAP